MTESWGKEGADIVERLREGAKCGCSCSKIKPEAADEIERLRQENHMLKNVMGDWDHMITQVRAGRLSEGSD